MYMVNVGKIFHMEHIWAWISESIDESVFPPFPRGKPNMESQEIGGFWDVLLVLSNWVGYNPYISTGYKSINQHPPMGGVSTLGVA